MKNWIVLILAVSLFSCERVPLDETRESVETGGGGETDKVTRKAFLEYYTGHSCGNCPEKGSAVIDMLKSIYQEDIIVMSIHAGFFANPRTSGEAYTYDFRSNVGDQLNQTYGNAGTPKGTVNRLVDNGTVIHTPTAWGSIIDEVVSEEADFQIAGTFVKNGTSLELNCGITSTSNSSDYFPKVYIVEDSIINWQKDYSLEQQDIPNYAHRDVLRAEMNVSSTSLSIGENILTASLSEDAEWNPDQIYAIVLVCSESDESVAQVEKIKLTFQ